MKTNEGARAAARRLAGALALGVALLGLAAAAAGSEEEDAPDPLAAARARGSIEIAVYADFPPYSYGGAADAHGIDVDLARAIARKLGLSLKLRMVNAGETASDDLRNHLWKGHYLGGGVADVMLHVGFDREFAAREPNVAFFEPYFHEVVALAYKPNRIKNVESPLALTEHKIAVEGDTISDHIMSSAYGGALRNSAVREQSLKEAVQAFKDGAVDAVMGPEGELEGLLAEERIGDVRFHVQEPVGQMRTAWDVGVAVKSGASGSLKDAVATIIESFKQDGSLKRIFAVYGVSYLDASSAAVGDKLAVMQIEPPSKQGESR